MSVPEINELIEKCVQDVATKDFREYYDEYEEWIKKGIEGEFFVWLLGEFNLIAFFVFSRKIIPFWVEIKSSMFLLIAFWKKALLFCRNLNKACFIWESSKRSYINLSSKALIYKFQNKSIDKN